MELTFLGTGAGAPSKMRNVTSIALNLLQEHNGIWLFDCGEGTQQQLLRTRLSTPKIKRIFITHLHGDHIFGLPGLLSSRSMAGCKSPLTLYGPRGIRSFVEIALRVSESFLGYPFEIIEIEPETTQAIIWQDERFEVEAFALEHRISCFGYRIVEQDQAGQLDAARLQAEGVPSGTLYAQLKRGESVELADGRWLHGKDYLLPSHRGRVVAICGDTIPTPASLQVARQADLLVHEATQASDLVALANDRGHSTTEQAATIALQSQAKHLVVTHISPRYGEQDLPRLLQECRAIFPHTDIASDLASFVIPATK